MIMKNNLERFVKAQAGVYETALKEIRQGRKNPTGFGIYFHSSRGWDSVRWPSIMALLISLRPGLTLQMMF